MPDRTRSRLPIRPESPGPFSGLPLSPGEDLLAAGGELAPELVLHAYRHGVFPWYGEGDPVLWWCPDPRAVLPLSELHVPRRLKRTLHSGRFSVSQDTCFEPVVRACAENRPDGTWIHPELVSAYVALHREGHARSFEVWAGGGLVGGLYGVAVGAVFCAESKFHRVRDASKVALVAACQRLAAEGFTHLEAQFVTQHLRSFGVRALPREAYLRLLDPGGGAPPAGRASPRPGPTP